VPATLTAIASSIVAVAAGLFVARLNHYVIEDASGFAYLYVATPLVAIIASSFGMTAARHARPATRYASTIAGVAVLAGAFHQLAIGQGWVGGTYTMPPGLDLTVQDDAALVGLVRARNDSVSENALRELTTRGPGAVPHLLRLIDEERDRWGERYVNSHIVATATEALARSGEPRAIPVLRDMLRSNQSYVETRTTPAGVEQTRVYTTRARAQRLLREHFGESVTVTLREPIE
jgi:hypothetical protein